MEEGCGWGEEGGHAKGLLEATTFHLACLAVSLKDLFQVFYLPSDLFVVEITRCVVPSVEL